MSPGSWVHCRRVFSVAEIADIRQTVVCLPGLGGRELAARSPSRFSFISFNPRQARHRTPARRQQPGPGTLKP
ncbi:MAG TPA: hypothetical protein VES73_10125 [Lamprocystis sp. (in: g-proteobacteria)]|nr:hypothetical protein [Lamprocystis sp. (in: g-proteobacteria)]